MPSRLLRSTPVRLILWIGSALTIGLVVAGAVAFALIHEELLARTDRDVQNTWTIIAQAYPENDAQDLSELVASHIRAGSANTEVFRLTGPDNRDLASNIGDVIIGDGWSTLEPAALGLPDDGYAYRVLAGQIHDHSLVVGTSLRGVDDIGGIVVVSLSWVIGGLALVILVIGTITAVGGQRRLDSIAHTMELVARGDLKARIPLSGRRDDVDALVASVNAALDRLAALVEGMRQVSVDIAHELKTPLNRLSIAISTARDASDGGRAVPELLDEAQQEIGQVIAIFDAMLRIAQIEAGARRARFATIALRPIIENIFEAYDAVAADNGQTLSITLSNDLGSVWGDRDLITQALANLVENAIRYCPPGASIALRGSLSDGRTTIAVADDGPGIPDDEKIRVFDRLYRVEKSRSTPGNGLGLSLVKAIVDLHGASITLEDNKPGLIVRIAFAAPSA